MNKHTVRVLLKRRFFRGKGSAAISYINKIEKQTRSIVWWEVFGRLKQQIRKGDELYMHIFNDTIIVSTDNYYGMTYVVLSNVSSYNTMRVTVNDLAMSYKFSHHYLIR
jgi:hypothetical protein